MRTRSSLEFPVSSSASIPSTPELAIVADSSTAATAVPPRPVPGRIYDPLPRMWVGMTIAAVCFLCQLVDSDALVFLVSMLGSCYWLFCVHRFHKMLAECTRCAYPISPRRAVGFHFIPVFEYFWFFRWTRQLARFLDEESGGKPTAKVWPGVLLTGIALLGWFPLFKSFRLFVVFGLGIYFTRKLRRVLPECQPLSLRRAHQWKLATSAGVGAAFSFVLFQSLYRFFGENRKEQMNELATILVVSIGVLIFLEPVFDGLRKMLGVAESHSVVHESRPWSSRLAVFAILVFASLFHGLMDSNIAHDMRDDWVRTLTVLAIGTLVSGGITYFWVAASHRHPSHAARSGLLSGAVLGVLVASQVISAASTPNAGEELHGKIAQAVGHEVPLVPRRVLHEIEDGKLSDDVGFKQVLLIAIPWPILGLIGGLAIDRRWGKGRVHGVALSMLAAAVLYEGLLWFTRQLTTPGEMLSHLSVAAGWGLALTVCSSSGILIPAENPEAEAAIVG
jgi:hypothetical protein